MRVFWGLCVYILVFLAYFTNASFAQELQSSSIKFLIDRRGSVSAELQVRFKAPNTATPIGHHVTQLWLFAIPLGAEETPKFRKVIGGDAWWLRVRRDYSILLVSTLPGSDNVTLEVDSLTQLLSISGGLSEFRIDHKLSGMSSDDKSLLTFANSITQSNIEIVLPEVFENKLVNYDANIMVSKGHGLYFARKETLQNYSENLWIVFPNLMKSRSEWMKAIVSLTIGLITAMPHINAWRERRVIWTLIVLLLSLGAIVGVTYYSFQYARDLELLYASAGLAPHAFYGVIGGLFLLLAKYFQGSAAGHIRIDGAPARSATVSLMETRGSELREISRTESLNENGGYKLYVWMMWRKVRQLKVVANTIGASKGESTVFSLSRRDEKDVQPINLVWVARPGDQSTAST